MQTVSMKPKVKRLLKSCVVMVVAGLALYIAMRVYHTFEERRLESTAQDVTLSEPFVQQEAADLVVWFWHWDSWRIEKPRGLSGSSEDLTKGEFEARVGRDDVERQFVVCVFGKRTPPAGMGATMDELEAFFRKLGFSRIVFQQATSRDEHWDWPILRDSREGNPM